MSKQLVPQMGLQTLSHVNRFPLNIELPPCLAMYLQVGRHVSTEN